MIHLDVSVGDLNAYPGGGKLEAEDVQSPATAPWLCCIKPHTHRLGPSSTPLPGVGAFVTLSSANTTTDPIALVVLPTDDMLKKGIALPDIEQFLETPTGSKFWMEHCKILHLAEAGGKSEARRVAWVPYGWIMLPLLWVPPSKETCEDEDDETPPVSMTKTKDKDQEPIAFLFVHTLMSKHSVSNVTPTAWNAIATWNSEHLQHNEGVKVWKQRAKHFKKWAQLTENLEE